MLITDCVHGIWLGMQHLTITMHFPNSSKVAFLGTLTLVNLRKNGGSWYDSNTTPATPSRQQRNTMATRKDASLANEQNKIIEYLLILLTNYVITDLSILLLYSVPS